MAPKKGMQLRRNTIPQNLLSETSISSRGNDLCSLATLPRIQVLKKANTKASAPFRGVGAIIAKLIYYDWNV